MREPFVHEAQLSWSGIDDERAPGGAVTEELCGSIDHEQPCPLAAHFTSVVRREETLAVRVLFACDPADEARVRAGIDTALGRSWDVVSSAAGDVGPEEAEHARRLVAS